MKRRVIILACGFLLLQLGMLSMHSCKSENRVTQVESAASVTGHIAMHGALPSNSSPSRPINVTTSQSRSLSYTYKESMKRVQNELHESIYLYNRAMNLPLMRLTASQTDRAFRVSEGRRWLKSQRLVVEASVRNAMSGLPTSVENLRRMSEVFLSVTAVFVENDSSDDTRSFLYRLTQQSTDKFRVILLGCGSVNSADPCRINITYGSSGRLHKPGYMQQVNRSLAEESVDRGLVMAALRNIYLQFIYDRVDADLLLVLESDLVWDPWDISNIVQGLFHFMSQPKLDSLCSTVTGYGGWGLHDPCTLIFFSAKHFNVDASETQGPFIGRIRNPNHVFKKHLNVPFANAHDVPSQPVKVASCFQGAAFYRMSSLRAASAFYRYSEGEWHCEHSTLSMQLRENYLDTQMRTSFSSQIFG